MTNSAHPSIEFTPHELGVAEKTCGYVNGVLYGLAISKEQFLAVLENTDIQALYAGRSASEFEPYSELRKTLEESVRQLGARLSAETPGEWLLLDEEKESTSVSAFDDVEIPYITDALVLALEGRAQQRDRQRQQQALLVGNPEPFALAAEVLNTIARIHHLPGLGISKEHYAEAVALFAGVPAIQERLGNKKFSLFEELVQPADRDLMREVARKNAIPGVNPDTIGDDLLNVMAVDVMHSINQQRAREAKGPVCHLPGLVDEEAALIASSRSVQAAYRNYYRTIQFELAQNLKAGDDCRSNNDNTERARAQLVAAIQRTAEAHGIEEKVGTVSNDFFHALVQYFNQTLPQQKNVFLSL